MKHNKPSLTPIFRGFLVGATEPEKRTLKRVQLRILGLLFTVLVVLYVGQVRCFELLNAKWPEPQSTFHADISLGGSGVSPSGASWNQAFADAASFWSEGSVFMFDTVNTLSDPCAGILSPEDGNRNGVGFRFNDCGIFFGLSTLAVTTSYSVGQNTTETDIVFNSNDQWDVYSGPWRSAVSDFRRIATHELGHTLGLGHEDSASAIMASFVTEGGTIEMPQADDLNGVSELYGSLVPGPLLGPIVINLEEPAASEVKTGIANLRGWVVALAGVVRVELFIDGRFDSNIPVGGGRGDVAAAFPNYPSSGESGFSLAFNYGSLSTGSHTVRVRAVDQMGRTLETSNTFSVVRFENSFIRNSSDVNLIGATVTHDNQSIFISELEAEGRVYNLVLEWRVATQSYEVVEIESDIP